MERVIELIDAVINNDIRTVKDLLDEGVDPNLSIDDSELRAIHFAAQENLVEIGELLIKAGADIYARTIPDEETPLEIAQLHGNQEFIDLLLSHTKGGAEYIH